MSANSKIEWTDATWNPVRGCTKISPGCLHCYAETFAERFRGVPGHPFEQGFDLRLVPEKLGDPLRWSNPQRIFVNSMSDLFHPGVPDEYIVKVARVMKAANWHTYQILTKRAGRMQKLLKGKLKFAAEQPHIWWGVSVENRQHGLPRIDLLRDSPAQVRFLSIEPLLEHSRSDQLERHQLGDCRRRKRAGRAANGSRLGAGHPRAMSPRQSCLLFQAMGWRPQKGDRPGIGRPYL